MWNEAEGFTFLSTELLRTPECGQEAFGGQVQFAAVGTLTLTGFRVLFPVFLSLRKSLEPSRGSGAHSKLPKVI